MGEWVLGWQKLMLGNTIVKQTFLERWAVSLGITCLQNHHQQPLSFIQYASVSSRAQDSYFS